MIRTSILPLMLIACGGGNSPTPENMLGPCPEDLSGIYEVVIQEKLAGGCDTVGPQALVFNVNENTATGETLLIITDEPGEETYIDQKVDGCELNFAFIYPSNPLAGLDPNKIYVYSLDIGEDELIGEVTIIDTSTIAICGARYAVSGSLL